MDVRTAYFKEPKVSAKNWRAEVGGDYWAIDNWGYIREYTEGGDEQDDHNFDTLNYHRTEKQAEAYKEYCLAIGTVSRAIWDANEKVEHDTGFYEINYNIVFDKFTIDRTDTEPLCLIPLCKSEETANQIINDHKTELEIIRNYKR